MKYLVLIYMVLVSNVALACWSMDAEEAGWADEGEFHGVTYAGRNLPNFKCIMTGNGYVHIQYEHQIDKNRKQLMNSSIGKENDWNNPYQVRQFCETIKNSIKAFEAEKWGQEMCSHFSDYYMASYKYMGFRIETATTSSKILWFSPYNTEGVDSSFYKIGRNVTDARECL